jgi:protein TonB
MAQSQAIKPRITASDRLGFTLFLALSLHAIVVLGVGFTPGDHSNVEPLPSLDIILANSKTLAEVEKPDFLAQDNQAGGGNADDKARPSAPVSAATPIDQRGLADRDQPELRKQQLAISNLYYLTQSESDSQVRQEKQQRANDSNSKQASEADQRQTKIARLQAEIRQMTIDYAKRPKTITLTASTRPAKRSKRATWRPGYKRSSIPVT